jgi:hypothetical protein
LAHPNVLPQFNLLGKFMFMYGRSTAAPQARTITTLERSGFVFLLFFLLFLFRFLS